MSTSTEYKLHTDDINCYTEYVNQKWVMRFQIPKNKVVIKQDEDSEYAYATITCSDFNTIEEMNDYFNMIVL